MKNIITNFGGEFGWFLMRFQAIFRAIKEKHPDIKIVIASRPGLYAIVKDYVEEYIEIDYGSKTDGWRVNEENPILEPKILEKYKNYIYMDGLVCMKGLPQSFIKFGKPYTATGYKYVVIHPRNTTKVGTEYRNWSLENWNKLVKKISDLGFLVATIGTKDTLLPDNTKDMRSIPIDVTMDLLYNSELVLGPSSGPIHLASLCGASHVVWTDDKVWESCGGTNRYRYETSWNPLGTKAIVLDEDNWQPPVDTVYNAIYNAIGENLHG